MNGGGGGGGGGRNDKYGEKRLAKILSLQTTSDYLKADFHSAENVARSTFYARFLLKCVH